MPAKTRAEAPVKRFWVEESFGRTLLEVVVAPVVREVLFATSWRMVERVVKYSAEPKPVRSAEGTVPRHSELMGCGPERMERRTGRREVLRDCCTRVLRRSAGCKRTAEDTPLPRPARKWKVGWAFFVDLALVEAPSDIAVVGLKPSAWAGWVMAAAVASCARITVCS
jgi:hypothetical protein